MCSLAVGTDKLSVFGGFTWSKEGELEKCASHSASLI